MNKYLFVSSGMVYHDEVTPSIAFGPFEAPNQQDAFQQMMLKHGPNGDTAIDIDTCGDEFTCYIVTRRNTWLYPDADCKQCIRCCDCAGVKAEAGAPDDK